jgi:DUF4097 and DUF4098 domain-containing protein YvlB
MSSYTGTFTVQGLMAQQLKIFGAIGSSSVNNSDISTLVMSTATGSLTFSNSVALSTSLTVAALGDINLSNIQYTGPVTGSTVKGNVNANGITMSSDTASMSLTTQWGDANIQGFQKGSLSVTANAGNANLQISNLYSGSFNLQGMKTVDVTNLNVTLTTNTGQNKLGTINGQLNGAGSIFAKSLTGSISLQGQ